jgi:hypothetical protein
MTATKLQAAAMTVSAALVPVAFAGENWICRSNLVALLFALILYASVLTAVTTTLARQRKEGSTFLAGWRRVPYEIGIFLLLVLSLCPIATWLMALNGTVPHSRMIFLFLFGANAAAIVLVWFGRGWSRIGLTIVAFWICFLWAFPFGVGV